MSISIGWIQSGKRNIKVLKIDSTDWEVKYHVELPMSAVIETMIMNGYIVERAIK